MRTALLTIALAISMASTGWSWGGYDWDEGASVDIGRGNLVRPGLDIEIYDYGSDGGYKDVRVEDIYESFGRVVVEVYDYETGEHRTFDMDGE